MYVRFFLFGLFALTAGLSAGCKPSTEVQSAPPETARPSVQAPIPAETVARVHWLGTRRLAGDTNSAFILNLWNGPDGVRLKNQTLDKLATAPARLVFSGRGPFTNSPLALGLTSYPGAALLRPLLTDVVQQESYLEIRNATNLPGELAFAIRLDEQRAASWETNLAAAFKEWTGKTVTPVGSSNQGWRLQAVMPVATSAPQPAPGPGWVEFRRSGEWTLFGLGPEKSVLLNELADRISQGKAPTPAGPTNYWVEADLDPGRVASALGIRASLPPGTPKVAFTCLGDGENLRTRGGLIFPNSLQLGLVPWTVPTNLIFEPLISFTAAQGLSLVMPHFKLFSELKLDSPRQAYAWALNGVPFQQFFAAEVKDATNTLVKMAPEITNLAAAWIPKDCGALTLTNSSLVWTGFIAFTPPYLEPVADSGKEFLLAGIYPVARTRRAPAALLSQVLGRTNLVYYDWEWTAQKIIQWRFLDDSRFVFFDPGHRPMLRNDSATADWFRNCLTNAGNTVTEVTLTDSNRLSFMRKSVIGFTGLELHLLENWLESPAFPQLDFSTPVRPSSLPRSEPTSAEPGH